jgi:predicted DNA-binding ribbon-helix-helix protein
MTKSSVIKRSIVIGGTKTSISIEDPFWQTLKQIAAERSMTLSALVSSIKTGRQENGNLSSTIRVFILGHLRSRLASLLERRDRPADTNDRDVPRTGQVEPVR